MKKILMITEILCSIGLLFSCIVLLIIQNTVSYETADTFEKTLKSNIFIVMVHNPTLGYLFLILGITLGFVGAVKLHFLMKERQSKKIPEDDSIKYYDYPERTRKQTAKAIAERNMK